MNILLDSFTVVEESDVDLIADADGDLGPILLSEGDETPDHFFQIPKNEAKKVSRDTILAFQ